MALHCGKLFSSTLHSFCHTNNFPFLLSSLYIFLTWMCWCCQAVQLTHILGERVSELAEDAEQEKTLKDVAIDMA